MTTLVKTENKIKILLVEDNPSDAKLVSLALKGSDVPHELVVLSNGEAVLDYLQQNGPYAGSPRPDLVFLDLNLPRLNGVEILLEIRKDPSLRYLPVVVLSVSDAPENIRESYDAGADLFITKPTDLDHFSFIFQYVTGIFRG
ncbi:MAG TPA: response regulator, partial [bacterium]|nr:response regulator [bacterium]